MEPMTHLTLATAAFVATHFVSSTPLRAALVRRLGENGYLGLYSLVAFALLGWMIWSYPEATGSPLWSGLRAVPLVVMPVALILVACGVMSRNPTAVRQANALDSPTVIRGILRITRHPMMWGFALWGGSHLLARGDEAALVFFGGLALLALAGTRLIDARKAATLGEDWRRFAAATSNIPFAAILAGRNEFRPREIGWKKIIVGLMLYLVLLLLHPFLFGVRPY
ncbi:MAG: NnrU family protein [Pseudomonadota bacterium]